MTLRTCALMLAMSLAACGGSTSSSNDMASGNKDMGTTSGDMATQPQGDMAMPPPVLTIPSGCDPASGTETATSLATLVQTKCFGGTCHNNGSLPSMKTAAELLALKNKQTASNTPIPYVTPSDPDKSYLLYKLTNEQLKVANGNGSQMPQGSTLMASELCRFIRWVKLGAN